MEHALSESEKPFEEFMWAPYSSHWMHATCLVLKPWEKSITHTW